MRRETVSIIYQHPRILLGMKKQKFGKGMYNGFGGGIENGETEIDSVVRETYEEAGITIINPKKMGKILFEFETDEQNHLVYFFRVEEYLGAQKESNEMLPKWFNVDEIPYNQMWSDDVYWLPLLLDGKKFEGNFVFDEKGEMVRRTLKEVVGL